MLFYRLLFAFFAIGALAGPMGVRPVFPVGAAVTTHPQIPFKVVFILGAILITCLVGLRYEVGADWFTYSEIFNRTRNVSLSTAMGDGDPAFQFVNWAVAQSGIEVWLVNLICGAIFTWGLYRFCRIQPSPWLAATIAVPYLILVVAMGYTRQSVALGILMAGLARQTRGANVLNFVFYVVAAALFHRTAVVMFPLVALAGKGSRIVNLLMLLCGSILFYQYFINSSMDTYVSSYLDTDYSSKGAFVRVTMNLVAAIGLWVFRGKLGFTHDEYKIWRNFSLAALGFFILLGVISSSTVVDRLSLYVLPLQIAVLTRIGLLGQNKTVGIGAILIYLFTVQFVWLNFAQHARFWVPYQFYPL